MDFEKGSVSLESSYEVKGDAAAGLKATFGPEEESDVSAGPQISAARTMLLAGTPVMRSVTPGVYDFTRARVCSNPIVRSSMNFGSIFFSLVA